MENSKKRLKKNNIHNIIQLRDCWSNSQISNSFTVYDYILRHFAL